MGTTGRPGVVHFADVTHGTRTGEQRSGVRPIQIHPQTARGNDGEPGVRQCVRRRKWRPNR
jgi:hypothetical protein